MNMESQNIGIFLLVCVFSVEAICLYEKHHQKKMKADTPLSYRVRSPLGCEKLCLEMGSSCQAANVLYTKPYYTCEVVSTFPYDEAETELTFNKNGKLIVKKRKYR